MRHDDHHKKSADENRKIFGQNLIRHRIFFVLISYWKRCVEFNHGDPLGGSSSDHHHIPAGSTAPPSRPCRELASQPSIGFGGDRGILFFSNVVSIFRRNFSSINGIDVGIPDSRGRCRCHGVGGDVGGDVSVLLHLYCPDRGT